MNVNSEKSKDKLKEGLVYTSGILGCALFLIGIFFNIQMLTISGAILALSHKLFYLKEDWKNSSKRTLFSLIMLIFFVVVIIAVNIGFF
ncbi:hypothetical protein [Evansella cellulosilytica]|uniref:Uncharacterized protein n=1 Tax=Evansella cellulosilytica (strain ATCC 21833 / DSM 2522 / FERM P-1141 / JCM 9156 / N-4) TaxID=649639 RepID=E6TVP7_EVAC2|nr:hypothetical protein [Evansella cellulosilytica]ADU32175.1 hypothetical protein Bcell_3941 [Evansella cellulosilytica DSM 2522]